MKYQVNLFSSKEQNITDKVIYFSFHYLRYILVITQLVVICVFFYRFQVDQEIVDLKDSLAQKEQIVKATEPLLKEVEQLSKKIGDINNVIGKQTYFQELYSYFLSKVPATISVTNFQLENNTIKFEGTTQSFETVKELQNAFIQDGRFKQVQLHYISNSNLGYAFAFTLTNYQRL
jgi:Tfp pilus assembly protein PilN